MAEIPSISPFGLRLFLFYLEGYFARSFHAVRISRRGRAPEIGGRPLIVYANHPSWWDPIHFVLMASHELPERQVYGPFDAEALGKYGFFEKLGAFGVNSSLSGSRKFLETSLALLPRPGASLWLTPEGELTDARQRPLRLQAGLARLARRVPDAVIVPLAVEYPFWNERRPEALSRFGPAIDLAQEPSRPVREWTELFEHRMTETLDALALEARSREAEHFQTLVAGRVGVSGIYDSWRRLKALVVGKSFHAAHGDLPAQSGEHSR